jgi:putative phosphoribosyl transferase
MEINVPSKATGCRDSGGTGPASGWLFRDREDAGSQLAPLLDRYRDDRPVVPALPRGGVPVAFPIARRLGAELDVLPVRKIGHPGQRELGLGAIALGGTSLLDREAIERLHVGSAGLARVEAEERSELERQNQRFRAGRPLPDLHGRTVILVDDGLATGLTALTAVRAVRALGPRRIVLAVPVCAPEAMQQLRPDVDDFVAIACPESFFAVGLWYRDFRPTPDGTVLSLLERAARERAGAKPQVPEQEPGA